MGGKQPRQSSTFPVPPATAGTFFDHQNAWRATDRRSPAVRALDFLGNSNPADIPPGAYSRA